MRKPAAGASRQAAPRGAIALPDPHPALQHLDPSTAFLYAPHTVSFLLAGAAAGCGVLQVGSMALCLLPVP